MRRSLFRAALLIAAVACLQQGLHANVFPSGLAQSASGINPAASETTSLSFILNENADTSVKVEVLDSSNAVVRTFNMGPLGIGTHSVAWDGKDDSNAAVPNGVYSFKVTASDDGYASWTLITTDGVSNNFEIPRGLGVNKNPASRYYGRVYVTNGRAAATEAGRAMGDGVYILNSDLSAVAGPLTGGVDWTTDPISATTGLPSGTSPWKLQIGPDDRVYITDWSDLHGGLWVADPDVEIARSVFDNTAQNVDGKNDTHGSISDVWIEGTGASRKVFTADEDFYLGSTAAQAGSIWRYDIGLADMWTGAPSALIWDNSITGWNINFFNSLAHSPDGTWWYSQTRSAGTDKGSLIQIDQTGAILWDSLPVIPPPSPDVLRGIQAIAFDPHPDRDWLVLATYTAGNIIVFDDDTKAILASFPFGGTTNCDVDIDAVGNVYVSNRSIEWVRVWSPPSGPNSSSTSSLAPIGGIYVTPLKVTINQAPGQADPGPGSPINFQAVFSAPVTGFGPEDIEFAGTAGPTTAVVTGGPTTYNVAVSGMTLNGGTVIASVKGGGAQDGSSNINAPSTSTDNSVVYLAPTTVGEARQLSEGSFVLFQDVVVSKVSGTDFWVQEKDRSAGIRVNVTSGSPTITQDTLVDLQGTLTVTATEKYVKAAGADISAPGAAFTAVPVIVRGSDAGGLSVTGGSGTPNDGLLATIAGKVTDSDFYSYLYVDDGSPAINDSGTGAKGIKVDLTTGTFGALPSAGQYVKVTGVLKLIQAGENIAASVLPRTDSDIAIEQ